MKYLSNNYFRLFAFAAIVALTYNNCSSSGGGGGSSGNFGVTSTTPLSPITGSNVMTLTLGGYGNEPYVNVTVCEHGSTTNCYVIQNLLLDSGSSGIRIFSNNVPPGFPISLKGECETYDDGTIDWGPVSIVDVVLGSERATSVPIQIIDSAFGDGGSKCYSDDVTWLQNNGFLSTSGCTVTNQASGCPFFDAPSGTYSGIIGVNFLLQDCGSDCATTLSSTSFWNSYYSCTATASGTCSSTTMPLADQVSNPIGFLPSPYNNGLMIQMPSTLVDNNLTGYAVLGIGTSNSTPSGVTVMTADPNEGDYGYTMMQTYWQNQTIYSFLDTGSNTYNFPYSNTSSTSVSGYPIMPVDGNTGFFTPTSNQEFQPTNIGYNGTQSTPNVIIENVEGDFGTYNVVNYIGALDTSGPIDGEFDYGFPFFLGNTVYIGLENATSTLGTGLYWAY